MKKTNLYNIYLIYLDWEAKLNFFPKHKLTFLINRNSY